MPFNIIDVKIAFNNMMQKSSSILIYISLAPIFSDSLTFIDEINQTIYDFSFDTGLKSVAPYSPTGYYHRYIILNEPGYIWENHFKGWLYRSKYNFLTNRVGFWT